MGKTKDSAIIGSRVLSRNEVLKVLPTFDNLFYQIEDLRSQRQPGRRGVCRYVWGKASGSAKPEVYLSCGGRISSQHF